MPYTALILTATTDYAAIRDLLDVDATDVPDATIERWDLLPSVEAEITAVVTDYASLAGANSYRLKRGCAAWVAALLCQGLSVAQAESVQIGDYSHKASGVDWRAKASELMLQAAEALGAITTRTLTRRTALALAGPTRSGSNVPADTEAWLEKIQPRLLDWIEEGGEDD